MKDTTAATNTKTGAKENFSQAPARKLSFAQKMQMQCLCGEGSSTEAANAVLTAPYSETKAKANHRRSYNKRIKLLLQSGLVAGITPTSVRQQSPQATLDFVFCKRDGQD
jgi:hypothetical protein